ncbi:hypothetical protein F5884DRAFT_73053 [Xylogone sp. PMI_703]|nr:hypothetical protein F5884DRAFT_73053 [Xylogone sp. PMI_703]
MTNPKLEFQRLYRPSSRTAAGEGAAMATAMTSPHVAATEVVATTASAAFEQGPQTAHTAADHAEMTIPKEESEERVEINIKQENDEMKRDVEDIPQQHNRDTTPTELPDASIADGANLLQDAQSSFQPPAPMADMSQMDALNALMAYAQPLDVYQPSINGLQLPTNPTDDLPALSRVTNSPGVPQPYLDDLQQNGEPETRISAYAKLEFPDGEFYMNTYSVVLGRDLAAAKAAMRREAEEERRKLEEEAAAREPHTPVRVKREGSRYSKSVVSESGGILREGVDSDSDEHARRRKSRKPSKKSKSTGSSSQHISRRNSIVQPNGMITYQAQSQIRRYADDPSAPVDPASLRPSPFDCPLVGIHPPAATAASGYKAISRKHVKIAYNSKKHLFEAEIIGRNGAFVDEEFYHHNDVIPLKSGSELQIGGVVVKFVLPDVAIGETGAEQRPEYDEGVATERYSEGGKEMSFDFEDTTRDRALLEDTSEELSEGGRDEDGDEEEEEEEEEGEGDDDDDEGEEEEAGDVVDNSDLSEVDEDDIEGEADEHNVPEPNPLPQKRRGPGRPPKNGIMSKREQQQLAKKQAQEKAKKTVQEHPVPTKNKVGRPRKHPRPDTPPIKTEKRKYTKRKPKEPKDPLNPEGSGDDERTKEKKEKKPPKPPRSPSPKFNEADLTPEQLAKPQANYVQLIYEALSNSPSGQMSLPQIYRAIQRKYPFFVLKCSTNGWQSSVRHNLSQHHAFRKVERDGKGWMWAIVEGVSIEKEKKRRMTPPPQMPSGHMHHQPLYRAGPQHMMGVPPGYQPNMMQPPPGYAFQMPPNTQPGQPLPYMGSHQHISGQPLQHMINGQATQPFIPPIPPGAGPNGPTYSSPYAPKPATTTQVPSTGQAQPSPAEQRAPNQDTMATNVPQQRVEPPPPPIQITDNVRRAVEIFKNSLLENLKKKSNNAEAIIDSAVNRVLGIAKESTVGGDSNEEYIMNALRSMLTQITGSSIKTPQPTTPSQTKPQTPQPPANANSTPPITQQPQSKPAIEKSAPTIMRPSFNGQSSSRSGGPSLPRPPLMTPGMNRTNSASSTNATPRLSAASASPVPAPNPTVANGAGTPKPVDGEIQPAAIETTANGFDTPKLGDTEPTSQAGQKRPHDVDDAEEMREFKRLSTSGPPQLTT